MGTFTSAPPSLSIGPIIRRASSGKDKTMKYWLWALAGLGLMLAVAGCSGNVPVPTSTPRPPTSTPVPAVAPTSTPSPVVAYLGGRFESGPTTGQEITVPAGSPVGVHVTLDATGAMRGELKVEVWKNIAISDDLLAQTCAEAVILEQGAQTVYTCKFTGDDLTDRSFTHYYLKAYLSGAPLVVEPRAGEGVRTVAVQIAATATPTPFPSKEWALEDIRVNGSTVTVLVRVYAGIDVRVTLDGREPDRMDAPLPILEFVFQNVAPGERSVESQDVVGHSMIAELLVPAPGFSD